MDKRSLSGGTGLVIIVGVMFVIFAALMALGAWGAAAG